MFAPRVVDTSWHGFSTKHVSRLVIVAVSICLASRAPQQCGPKAMKRFGRSGRVAKRRTAGRVREGWVIVVLYGKGYWTARGCRAWFRIGGIGARIVGGWFGRSSIDRSAARFVLSVRAALLFFE